MPRFAIPLLAVALLGVASTLSAQGHSLNGASLGTNAITVTIPKTGNAQAVHSLRLQYSGSGASCTTGSLNDYWSPSGQRAPVGVTPGYTSSGMGLPGVSSRAIVLNVASNAEPMSRQWTIVVPRGTCGGSNQTATVTVTLVKAP